nr:glycosyl hydrolase-related protein [Clostridium sp. DMHC 10]
MKKAEDSSHVIIRVYECYNKRSNVTMKFFKNIESVCECNLMERYLNDVEFIGNKIIFAIKPYEIKSFKIKFDI